MGLSNYIPSSRVSQAGVCTSTTRPASPYEGQMIYETDTNRVLVYDNTAWVMIADTDAPPGAQHIKTTTLSGATTDVTSCFTDDFNVYLITLESGSLSGTGSVYVQMLSGTTPNTSSEYFWAYRGLKTNNTSADSNGSGQTSGFTGVSNTNANNLALQGMQMTVYGPKLAQRTVFTINAVSYDSEWSLRSGGITHNVTTAYDGIRFTTTSAVTMSGTVRVYGLRNS